MSNSRNLLSRFNNSKRTTNSNVRTNVRTNVKTNGSSNSNVSKNVKNVLLFLIKLIILILIVVAILMLIKAIYYYFSSCTEKKEFNDYILDFSFDPCLFNDEPTTYVERELKQEDEVYHLSNQDYTFPQAKCKCSAYGGRLATKEEITDAYNKGASWCSYGWSEGQNAYYPTQKCDFDKLQRLSKKDRFKCGLPGVNGGFFSNPKLKFGINCYGVKPKGKAVVEKDPVCNKNNKAFCERDINKRASKILNTDDVSAFNQSQWSQFDN